jgi:hypothetical protein
MSIRQFNGSWVPAEDRLLIRLSTGDDEEFRLSLTRRVTRVLLGGGRQLTQKALERTHAPDQAQAIREFEQQAIRQNADFSVAYQEARTLPLGEAPVLVSELVMRIEGEQISIDFRLANGRNLKLMLPRAMLYTFLLLLDRLQQQAQWDLDVAPVAQQPAIESVVPAGNPGKGVH